MANLFQSICFDEGRRAEDVTDPGLSLLVTRASLDELARALIHRIPEATAAQLDLIHELELAATVRCRELEGQRGREEPRGDGTIVVSGSPGASAPPVKVQWDGIFSSEPAAAAKSVRFDDGNHRRERQSSLDAWESHVRTDMGEQDQREWRIAPESLQVNAELGHGQFGRVFAGSWNGTNVAVKVLSDTRLKKNRELFVKEVEMMARMHHPHIVQFLGYCQHGPSSELCIVMELFRNRSVAEYCARGAATAPAYLSAATKRRFCAEMAKAIAYLHNRKPTFLIHRDIKPSNFMLTNSLHIKLVDFGVSRLFGRRESEAARAAGLRTLGASAAEIAEIEQTANCGTARYMAPEVASAEGEDAITAYSTAVDIFSLGMVYAFVHTRELPRIAGTTTQGQHLAALFEGRRPALSDTPRAARAIIERCWQTRPESRPSANELVEWWEEIEAGARGCLSGRVLRTRDVAAKREAAAAAFASLHLEDTPRESARAIDAHSVAQDDSPISVHSQRIAGLAS